jgi:predicted P-loop ATPase/GTPase
VKETTLLKLTSITTKKMFKFANEEVKQQWSVGKSQSEQVTKIERKESITYGFTTGTVRMYANPVERERMIVEKALKQEAETKAKFQELRNQTRKGINANFNQ